MSRILFFWAMCCGLVASYEQVYAKPLHVLMLDACFLPEGFELFRGQKIVVELMTSANPVLQYVHSPKPCVENYKKAVGPDGEVVKVHSHFFGDDLANLQRIQRYAEKLIKKRGEFDLIVSNNSDLANYVAQHLRTYFKVLPSAEKWNIVHSENFYDKYEMKKSLTQNDPTVDTAEFIDLNSSPEFIEQFFNKVDFPNTPVVLKKKRSAAAVGVEVIRDRAEFQKSLKKIKDRSEYLVERFIHGTSFRFNGIISEGKTPLVVAALHRTSPLDHYQNGKSRVTTTLDEDIIPQNDIRDFTERTLKALGMTSGTFHLEGILSDVDHKMYFVEIAARPGEGHVEEVYRETYGYDPKNTFFYQQTPEGFYPEEQEVEKKERYFSNFHKSKDHVFAGLVFPYLDANRFTFQRIQSNLTKDLQNGHRDYPTLVGCLFDETMLGLNEEQLQGRGASIGRLTFQAGLKAVACRFQGSRHDVDRDLAAFQERYYFKATRNHKVLNTLVPRSLFKAGGV